MLPLDTTTGLAPIITIAFTRQMPSAKLEGSHLARSTHGSSNLPPRSAFKVGSPGTPWKWRRSQQRKHPVRSCRTVVVCKESQRQTYVANYNGQGNNRNSVACARSRGEPEVQQVNYSLNNYHRKTGYWQKMHTCLCSYKKHLFGYIKCFDHQNNRAS